MVPALVSLLLAAVSLESAPVTSKAPVTAGPAASGDAGPVATSPLARPVTEETPAPKPIAAPSEPAMTAATRLTPPSAPPATLDPKDDYALVAWCHGALSGHMELYDAVKEELNAISPNSNAGDEEQMAAGREYLALYSRALKAAEAASPKNIHSEGAASDNAGRRIWAAASAAEPRTRMWSWLMWELPPACEIAAKRLEENSKLFGQALKGADKSKDLAVAEPAAPPADKVTGLRGLQ